MTAVAEVGLLLIVGLLAALVIGRRTNTLRFVAPISIVIVVLLAWLTWSSIAEATPWDEARHVGERTLEVAYTGGSCEDQRSVGVDEADDSVTITIRTRSFASGCDDMANHRTVTVRLSEPIGSRRLIDGSCDPKPANGSCTTAAAAHKAHPVDATG